MVSHSAKFVSILVFGMACSFADIKAALTLQPIRLADQHKVEHIVDGHVRLIIFSRDMDGNKIVREALEGMTKEDLERHKATCISDISQMPKLITQLLAMPKMKKYAYPVLLDTEARATKDFPYKEDHASLLYLNGLKVEKIEFISKSQDLRKRLSN